MPNLYVPFKLGDINIACLVIFILLSIIRKCFFNFNMFIFILLPWFAQYILFFFFFQETNVFPPKQKDWALLTDHFLLWYLMVYIFYNSIQAQIICHKCVTRYTNIPIQTILECVRPSEPISHRQEHIIIGG